ncbi:hypothetical protein [Acetobacter pasteurianus]|uniref:Uncharacterized protein n=1 Tax=Acetobacter pasteurianus subsp. pasteurianus TaxID=481145 RepID=A0A1Y0Y118_ACEPA|nr:hypothetical protein [Acetobacter pasteurianus]ARW47191.1 hypothetical protein S1001342_00836 [Acetobacter pasteurianus subsp. pasteurianus]
MEDLDGTQAEIHTLLSEISSDIDKLNSTLTTEANIPKSITNSVAMLADKIDALNDLMRAA